MSALDAVRDALPEWARDTRLNLQSVLGTSSLTPAQKWGVAVASAVAARSAELLTAVMADARAETDAAVLDDALAAASLMAMNNVYYRFRHMIGKPTYSERPARLRMNRLAKPAALKSDLELFSLAVSAIHGCEACVQSHEKVVLDAGLTEENVHDAVRIAAVVHAAALSLDTARRLAPAG